MCSYLIAYYIKVQTAANNCDVDKENDEDQLDSLHDDILVRMGVRSMLQGKKEKAKQDGLGILGGKTAFCWWFWTVV